MDRPRPSQELPRGGRGPRARPHRASPDGAFEFKGDLLEISYSGGWDFIRWHVPTLIGSGLSGMAYSTGNVDGIFGGSPETFARDLQWKCFTPVLMGMCGWSRAERKHPWWFDEPHRSVNRRCLKLRARLTPYLYTLAPETQASGAPMVRGLLWDSGPVGIGTLVKPVVDVRGLSRLELRAVAVEGTPVAHWADPRLEGHAGDRVRLGPCRVE